jgi:predicted transcriptional regulator
MLAYVLSQLPHQGDVHYLARLQKIAHEAGVSFHTLLKIAKGETSDPRISTVQTLNDYFRGLEQRAAA